jgi:NAD(P)-dependent dehydrogenase (short-subunit alcohol dehydrogenase family)
MNCRSTAVPHESEGGRELPAALSDRVNWPGKSAASRKRSFRLPQTHRGSRRGQPANPERRKYLRADSFSGSQALLPLLKGRQGQIVFINSSQGLQARANTGAYALTKHALKALVDSSRQEINADGIRILSIYPGLTATPAIKLLCEIQGQSYRPDLLLQPEDVAQVVLNTLQLPRTAEVTNIEIRPLIKSY